MAKNDYFVIVYKILEYLYECMKSGKRPAAEDLQYNSPLIGIPEPYWLSIMNELIESGYIKGIFEVSMPTGKGIKITSDASITLIGAEFLQENSRIQKAKAFAGDEFKSLLAGIIAQLPMAMATLT